MNNHFLLVEDDDVDAMIIQRALKDIKILHTMKKTKNGKEALEYLKVEKNMLPSLILLDLNMPEMDGREFLRIIKKDPEFKKIPVLVMTVSKEEKDNAESFGLGVEGYMVKLFDYKQFLEVLRLNLYWALSDYDDTGYDGDESQTNLMKYGE